MARVLIALFTLLLTALGTVANARNWYLDFSTGGVITMIMQPADHACPDYFQPVHMSTEFDEYEEFAVKYQGSELFAQNESDKKLAQSNPNLVMQMTVTGCAFRSHFIPTSGEVLFSGDLGVGRVESVRFAFAGEQRPGDQELSISYTAYLSNAAQVPRQKKGAIGELKFHFIWLPTPLVAPVHDGDTVRTGRAAIRVFVHPTDH
ncbi:hypothetical protein [Ruegeria arenilitoris]|uniref:hypothetical protein n=1 Tax=Ruegeria arenilitoris TaxID=1173585 RepID=UPI00147AAC11|nr:hypothetical protein [Ruegeria arenilitoris]